MRHSLTLCIHDVPAGMRAFDLLRRLNVAIHGFAAHPVAEGFILRISCDAAAFGAVEDLPARLSGLVGVTAVSVARDDGTDLLGGLGIDAGLGEMPLAPGPASTH